MATATPFNVATQLRKALAAEQIATPKIAPPNKERFVAFATAFGEQEDQTLFTGVATGRVRAYKDLIADAETFETFVKEMLTLGIEHSDLERGDDGGIEASIRAALGYGIALGYEYAVTPPPDTAAPLGEGD